MAATVRAMGLPELGSRRWHEALEPGLLQETKELDESVECVRDRFALRVDAGAHIRPLGIAVHGHEPAHHAIAQPRTPGHGLHDGAHAVQVRVNGRDRLDEWEIERP